MWNAYDWNIGRNGNERSEIAGPGGSAHLRRRQWRVREAQDLKIGLAAEPSSIDPHFHNLTPNNGMLSHVFERLVETAPDNKLIPGLATSWKTVDDKTWEFKLRANVKWHDGTPFTADDVDLHLRARAERAEQPVEFRLRRQRQDDQEDRRPDDPDLDCRTLSADGERIVQPADRLEKERHRRQDRGLQLRQGDDRHRRRTSSQPTSPAIASSSCATTTTGAPSRNGRR